MIKWNKSYSTRSIFNSTNMMSNLTEAVHYTKIETIYQRDLLVKISDTLLTFAWFHT